MEELSKALGGFNEYLDLVIRSRSSLSLDVKAVSKVHRLKKKLGGLNILRTNSDNDSRQANSGRSRERSVISNPDSGQLLDAYKKVELNKVVRAFEDLFSELEVNLVLLGNS
jgi:hypothetical protein